MPKISSLPTANAPTNSDVLAGVQNGVTKKFSLAIIADFLQNLFVPKTNIGVANGVASLDSTGKVPSSQLPPISSDAEDITYDPATSGASSTNVKDALDEAFDDLDDKQDTITANGILKGDGAGGVSAATAGTDYQAPLTAGTDYATPAQLADKANQAQLGYPETGTTASRNYSAGEYICWNGLTYTANQAISSGTTLSAGTGGNLTECADGGLNDLRLKEGTVTYTTNTYGFVITNIPSTTKIILVWADYPVLVWEYSNRWVFAPVEPNGLTNVPNTTVTFKYLYL